jgi:Ca2+-binding RTX toxin-like protein
VTLGHAADLDGITGVIGGTGSSTLTEGADFYSGVTLDGSNGSSNLFVVAGSVWLSDDTIIGGAGNDTLQITSTDSIDDSLFGNISGVEVLSLSGSSDMTLGSAAQSAGISSVYGWTGSNSILSSIKALVNVGDGNDTLISNSEYDTFVGGDGDKYVYLGNGGGNHSQVTLGNGNSTLVASQNFSSVVIGNGNNLILTASTEGYANNYTGFYNFSLGSGNNTLSLTRGNNDIVSVGNGDNSILVNVRDSSITAGSGRNLFTFTDSTVLASDVINTVGRDTLALNIGGLIDDSIFSGVNFANGGTLSLGGDSSSVMLFGNATRAGLNHVIGGGGGLTLDGSGFGPGLVVDNSAGITAASIRGAQYSSSTLIAGSGDDTLDGYGGRDYIIGGSGHNSLYGGFSGPSTLVAGTGSSVLNSGGSAALFIVDNPTILAQDTFVGGGILSLGSGSYQDSNFANVRLPGSLIRLSNASTLQAGPSLEASGIVSVAAGSGASTINASGTSTGLSIDLSNATASSQAIGGSGVDTIIGSSSADTVSGDTLTGGAGADQFVLGSAKTAATITDFDATSDILNLRNFGGLAGDYSLQSGFGGNGEGYTDQLFRADTLGGSTLVANINVVGGSSSDILTAGHVLFA